MMIYVSVCVNDPPSRRRPLHALYRQRLGIFGYRELHVYPYDITTVWSRLELIHHYIAAVTPDRGCVNLAH